MSQDLLQSPVDLTETRLDSQQVFEGGFLRVFRDQVQLPSGDTTFREYIDHPGAVVVVALQDDGRVVMERQFRYPMGRVMIELPAGKLDAGESPLLCGQRELLEETGYVAREWACAGAMHNAIAYSNEVIHIYFARGLILKAQALDQGEFLEVFSAMPDVLAAAVSDGRLTDAKTITALFWLQSFLSGQWSPEWMPAKGLTSDTGSL